jgi:hypothetical protein
MAVAAVGFVCASASLTRAGTAKVPFGPRKMPSCSACSYDLSSSITFCTIVSTVYTAKWYYRTHRQSTIYIAQNTHQQFGPLNTKRQLPWPIWTNYGKAHNNPLLAWET